MAKDTGTVYGSSGKCIPSQPQGIGWVCTCRMNLKKVGLKDNYPALIEKLHP